MRAVTAAFASFWLLLPFLLVVGLPTETSFGQDADATNADATAAACMRPVDAWFASEVWAKVGELECLKCHRAGGDAEDSRLVLREVPVAAASGKSELLRHNQSAFARMAKIRQDGHSLLLLKVTGGMDHGGREVLPQDSTGYRILADFVRRLETPLPPTADTATIDDMDSFFDGIPMLEERRLLRRATLSLAGRLPSEAELTTVTNGGPTALRQVLDSVTREDAFHLRLKEAFNDIFLTLGIDGNADANVLSYEHFEKTRLWYQTYDLSHIEDEKERRQAGYKLANDYRRSLLNEPMELVSYIVQNDRPFTEIVTADYIMVSPYGARGYGVFEDVKDRFQDPENPFEYIPVALKALTGRSTKEDQESATGFYPHAGLLSTFQYLSRYPTTETNRNRLRARMYYQHFLGVDVLELAARVSDAAAVTEKYEIPTMQASECVVCHKTLDPVAGMFQDYWRFDSNFSIYGRRKDGWFTDMFAAGFEGEDLPEDQRWRALQWLGERTARDPRFAIAMTEHAWYVLTGRRPMLPPKDLDDPLFASKQRAWRVQRHTVETIAAHFAQNGFNFRELLADLILSDLYRVDGVATLAELETASDSAPSVEDRMAELDDTGVVRLLSPEQLERKIEAVFGRRWGRLTEQTAMLYGAIDSKEVTERATDPSGAMGAIQRTMANDVACRNVAYDFSRPATDRILFPNIEPTVQPGVSDNDDAQIRSAIVHLRQRILGRDEPANSLDVERCFQLFAAVIADAKQQKGIDPREIYHCRQGLESEVPDPHYTVRAWRTVVTWLLRQQEFLYE
ncbi:MAG: hypothetical protein KDA96_13010 [Planctomycetaceae bacterium]|nr:hypothetical protein [Planctomycetaceae bacterium]